MHTMIPAIGFLVVAFGLTTAAGKSLTHATAFRHGARVGGLFCRDCTTGNNPESKGLCMSKINAGINPGKDDNGDVRPDCHWCAGGDPDPLIGNCRCGTKDCDGDQKINVYGFVHNNEQEWQMGNEFMLQGKNAGLRWQIDQMKAIPNLTSGVKKFFEGIYTTGTDAETEILLKKGEPMKKREARRVDDVSNLCTASLTKHSENGLLRKWFDAVTSNDLGKRVKFDFTDYEKEPETVVMNTLKEMGCNGFCKEVTRYYCIQNKIITSATTNQCKALC